MILVIFFKQLVFYQSAIGREKKMKAVEVVEVGCHGLIKDVSFPERPPFLTPICLNKLLENSPRSFGTQEQGKTEARSSVNGHTKDV